MGLFEYLMVMVSVILAVSLAQVLRVAGAIFRGEADYLPISLWALILFLLHLQIWWAFWDLRSFSGWNQFAFIFVALIPCALFVATEMLFPMNTSRIHKWNAHFVAVVRRFYIGLAAFFLLASVWSWMMLDVPLSHPVRILQVSSIVLFITGSTLKSDRANYWIPSIFLGLYVLHQVYFRFLPTNL